MECDNNADDFNAAPVAHPTLRFGTLIGNGSQDNKRGVRLRAGTEVSLENALICGKENGITAETIQTRSALANGTSVLKNIYMDSSFSEKVEEGQSSLYNSASFLAGGSNKEKAQISCKNRFVGTIDGNGAVDSSNDWTAGWTL